MEPTSTMEPTSKNNGTNEPPQYMINVRSVGRRLRDYFTTWGYVGGVTITGIPGFMYHRFVTLPTFEDLDFTTPTKVPDSGTIVVGDGGHAVGQTNDPFGEPEIGA